MRKTFDFPIRIALMGLIWVVWYWAATVSLSSQSNILIVVGGVLLTYPVVFGGRVILDRNPTPSRVAWATTFVHFALGFTFGIPLIRAVVSHQDWPGRALLIPPEIGFVLAILTGIAFLLVVLNLALKGLGAPMFIALSQKLAMDWSYAWTRNPMLLAGLAFLLSLGIWYQSAVFLLWVLILFAPALLSFVKVYEERELELRFGKAYLEYKSRTPMLFPRQPQR